MKKAYHLILTVSLIMFTIEVYALEPELVSRFKPVTGSSYFGDGTNTREREIFPFENVNDGRFNDTGSAGDWSFWLTGHNETGYIIIDLLDVYEISRFEIQNTHNRDFNDRGTRDFRIFLSADGENYEAVIDDTLPNVFGTGSQIPWVSYEVPGISARYVKFNVDSYYLDSGGLNELNVYSVPRLNSIGFDPPFDEIISIKKNICVPLKAELFDIDGNPVTDSDISNPPILVMDSYSSVISAVDSTIIDQIPLSEVIDGIQFSFIGNRWCCNLKIKDYYIGPGTYTFKMISGNKSAYAIGAANSTVTIVVEK